MQGSDGKGYDIGFVESINDGEAEVWVEKRIKKLPLPSYLNRPHMPHPVRPIIISITPVRIKYSTSTNEMVFIFNRMWHEKGSINFPLST